MHRCTAWGRVKAVMAAAGISGTHAISHALRHAFATYYVSRGVNAHDLQRWMGHSNIEMTLQYTNMVTAEE